MTADDYLDLDAVGQAELVARGELTARELVEATIRRVEPLHAELNFLASRSFDLARAAADDHHRSQKHFLGGVPLLIKDVTDYPGMPLAAGSRLFARHVSEVGPPYAQQLAAAGLIPLAKTTTSEFGLLGSTEAALYGPTLNPWNPEHSTGGSSGGAAAAVACRAVPLAHGNDSGGSIRGPASLCGVFGLKPSAGRTPRSTPADSSLTPLVSDHCLCLSVRDSAAFLAATERSDANAPLPPVGYVTPQPLPRALTIGYYRQTLVGAEASAEVLPALAHAVELCRSLGHELVEIDPPPVDGRALSEAYFTAAGAAIDPIEAMVGCPLDGSMVEPFTLALLAWYRSLPHGALASAHSVLERVAAQVRASAERCDVLLTPTVPIAPPRLGYLAPDQDRELIIERMEVMAGYTCVHNIAGLPAMSVPLHWTDRGLPVGSHFAARVGEEQQLLQLAYQLEEACPWRPRRPPITAPVVARAGRGRRARP